MQKLLAVLQRLTSAAGVTESGRLGRALDPDVELAEFDRRLRVLREGHHYDDQSSPPPLDVDALWQRWQRSRPSLRGFQIRELRALCWDRRAAADPTFLKRLVDDRHLPKRLGMLRGLWHVHQAEWRLETSATIESLIKSANQAAGYRPRWMSAMRTTPAILSAGASKELLRQLGDGWGVPAVLQRYAVLANGKLGQLVVDATLRRWLLEVMRLSVLNDSCVLLHEGHSSLMGADTITLPRFREVVQDLLMQVPKGTTMYRTAVAHLILSDDRLGHPKRVGTRGNWAGFRHDAIQTAVQLFAARDLGAFFEILIERGEDEQHRRPFWERYVESPQLVNFAIACDPADKRLLFAKTGSERATASHLDDAPEHHSAFIMRFKGVDDITIVEMSKANKALYLFESADFEQYVGSLEERRFNYHALRDTLRMLQRMTHRWPWHERFAVALREWGIYPGPSR
jgi:hypothetical protein